MGRWDSSSSAEDSTPKKQYRKRSRRESPAPRPSRAKAQKPDVQELRLNALVNGCRRLNDHYKVLNKISEGSFGCVYRGCRLDGSIVALKRIKFPKELEAEGFPIAALREISCLLDLRHANIIEVAEVVVDDESVPWMIMEYIEHELCILLKLQKPEFSLSERKRLLFEILEGVAYIHSKGYCHRDLKTANILYSNSGLIKICDFGLAKRFLSNHNTAQVATLWYRAPECILGGGKYSFEMDMWAVGCIFAEIWMGKPLFGGSNPQQTMDLIVKLLGTPTLKDWSLLLDALYGGFRLPRKKSTFLEQFPSTSTHLFVQGCMSDLGRDLLQRLLCWDASRRISAAEALSHPFFSESPVPQSLAYMPSVPETNDSLKHRRDEFEDEDGIQKKKALPRYRVNAEAYLAAL